MPESVTIRHSVPNDLAALEALYPDAFPDEDLVPLVRDLLQDTETVLSLVAVVDSEIVGHVAFTPCGVEGSSVAASLLAPLAVASAHQRQGIGSALVREGMERLRRAGVCLVCVLGDPAYYSRFGFSPDELVEPPYPLPAEWRAAWQSQYLDDADAPVAGKLSVPPAWCRPELWAP